MPILPLLLAVQTGLTGLAAVPAPDAPPRERDALELVHASLDAMGGEARWRALGSLRLESTGHQHALEQSERPAGPWLTTYLQTTELRDLDGERLRSTIERRGFWSPTWSGYTLVAEPGMAVIGRGERWTPAQPTQHDQARERLALGPERILLTALAAPDLRELSDTVLQGVAHDVVAFTWDARPVKLFLNRHTRLPAGYGIPAPEGDLFEAIWGDAPTLTLWSLWSLEPGAWLYPRQTDVFRLGRPASSELRARVTFDAPAPADSFDIPAEARTAFDRGEGRIPSIAAMRPGMDFQGGRNEAQELAPGVVSIPGAYATTFVEQEDQVVILEAPMTSAWSAAVLAESGRRFPDKPVRAVVTTSDAWPHIDGLREYAARGIPLLTLDLNVPIVERLLAAPRLRTPDALATTDRSPEILPVDGPRTIGEGPNRVELYPVRGEGGERMMTAWLPDRRILYASDLLQIQPDGTAFWPEYLMELVAVVERHGLEPETVFAMHTPPVPWSRVVELLTLARGATSGGGGG